MKSTITLLLFTFSISAFCQKSVLDETISIYFFESNFPAVFQKIEDYSNAEFAWSEDFLPDTLISANFQNKKISFILDRLFQKSLLVYKVRDRQIFISVDENKYSKKTETERRFTLNGYLSDAESGEELIGGTIRIINPNLGCFTNSYGFFSLTMPEGIYELEATYIGYNRQRFEINLSKSEHLKIELNPVGTELGEIVVISEKREEGIVFGEGGTNKIDLSDLNNLPGLLGEKDMFGTLQLLPGIQATGEGNGGFSVRGGSSDQNLILLDEAPIYNPAHLVGLFSVFNSDAIKNVRVMKNNIPSEYRGRLSSVVDIHMKEGNNKEYKFSAGVGLLMTRLRVEGPFAKYKGSFMVAGRRTYHDLWIRPLTENDFRLWFYDLNIKGNYKINEKNRLFVSGYLGDDVFRIRDDFKIIWGNKTGTLRWNHLYNDQLFSNTTLIFSDFDFDTSTDLSALADVDNATTGLFLRTRVRNYHLKQTFNYYPNPENSLKFGLNLIHHTFIPGKLLDENFEPTGGETSNRFAMEYSLFASHDWHFSDNWDFNFGVHLSNFSVLGGNDHIYNYDKEGNRIDSTYYGTGRLIKNYVGFEPRISITRHFNNRNRVNLSYFRTIQYLQFLPSAFINNPASTWFPSSHIIQPQKANQVALGYYRESKNEKWELAVDIYGKISQNQIAYRDGARLELGSDIESQLVFGKAWSYGAEIMMKKRVGRLRGWTSLSLSEAKNQFNDINEGETFRSEFDRPISFSFVGIWEVSKKFTLSATWSYASGKVVTVPTGKFQIGNEVIDLYGRRNNFRMSDNHRLDLAFRWNKKTKRGGRRFWSLAIHNVYARKNASFVYVRESDLISLPGEENKAVEISLLPFFVPSFTFFYEI